MTGRVRDAEVLVVGAGPAGCAAAWWLASRGVRTLLLEAHALPRSKPCGDAVSPGAVPLLREMGVAAALGEAGAGRVVGWRVRSPDGGAFLGRFGGATNPAPRFGYCAPRRELDALLAAAAARAGAEVLDRRRVFACEADEGVEVRARGPDGSEERFAARLLVGADGLRSRVARLLGGVRRGRRRRLAIVGRFEEAETAAAALGGCGELRLSAEGVLGMAPLGRGRVNVTVVLPEARAAEVSGDRARAFRRRLARYGALEPLEEARPAGPLEVTGPFEMRPRRMTGPGILLAGDAAGYFDPFTGQGIHRALVTGRLAAAAAARILRHPAEERAERDAYARALRRFLAPSRRVQRLIDAAVTRPWAIDRLARLLARRPGLADLLVDVTGDRVPPRTLWSPRRLLAAWRTPPRSGRGGPRSARMPHGPGRASI